MHPFVKIVCFFFLLLLLHFMPSTMLYLLCVLTCLTAASINFSHFSRLIKRMRWLFISLLLVYAYATPGEYVAYFPMNFAPSYEGWALGWLQIAKLLIALASLSVLFSTSSKAHLLAGLFMLLSPLSYLGLDVERFTARLLLTLDYVDEMALGGQTKLDFYSLDSLSVHDDAGRLKQPLMLEQAAFTWLDKLLLALILSASLVCLALSLKLFTGLWPVVPT